MIQIDLTADAAYVYLPGYGKEMHVHRSVAVTDAVLVDLTDARTPMGVEVLGLQAVIPIGALVRLGIPDETIRQLLSLSSANFSVAGVTREADTK